MSSTTTLTPTSSSTFTSSSTSSATSIPIHSSGAGLSKVWIGLCALFALLGAIALGIGLYLLISKKRKKARTDAEVGQTDSQRASLPMQQPQGQGRPGATLTTFNTMRQLPSRLGVFRPSGNSTAATSMAAPKQSLPRLQLPTLAHIKDTVSGAGPIRAGYKSLGNSFPNTNNG
jgi:hypothetical protein